MKKLPLFLLDLIAVGICANLAIAGCDKPTAPPPPPLTVTCPNGESMCPEGTCLCRRRKGKMTPRRGVLSTGMSRCLADTKWLAKMATKNGQWCRSENEKHSYLDDGVGEEPPW